MDAGVLLGGHDRRDARILRMTGPRIGLVTPAYNQAQFLGATVDSVLCQDESVEYLVIDDGSSDETLAILESYGEKLTWRTRANRGQTATINEGWTTINADVLGWLNSDDTLLPGAISWVAKFFSDHPDVDVVYGSTVFTDSHGTPLGPPRGRPFDYKVFLSRAENPIPQPSAFVRRRVVSNIGLLDESLQYFMDWDFWLRAGVTHSIVHVPVPLSTYRLHAGAKGESSMGRYAPELLRVYEQFFDSPLCTTELRAMRGEAMLHAAITSAGYLYRSGNVSDARHQVFELALGSPMKVVRFRALRKMIFFAFGHTRAYSLLRRVRSFGGFGNTAIA